MTTPIERVLSCQSLPSLPAVALEVLELTRDPNVAVAQIARVVQNDPAISAKILKTVNSSFYGLSAQVARIDRAMGMLGLNTVKSLVLSFSLLDATKAVPKDSGLDMDGLWRRVIFGAAGARQVAKCIAGKKVDADEVFTAALFQDLGMLACIAALKVEYAAVVAQAGLDHSTLVVSERDALGFTHPQVGAELAKKWKLPANYESSIRFHHAPDLAAEPVKPMVRAVALGGLIAGALERSAQPEAIGALRLSAEKWFPGAIANLTALCQKVADDAKELSKLFDKPIGEIPDVVEIMAQANDQIVAVQMQSQQQVEQLAQDNAKLSQAAITDGLTGAKNRKCFDLELAAAWGECAAGGRPLGALFIDGDRFKSVNDTHGHATGDAVLQELVRRATRAVGSAGTVYRYGGEEFAVLLPGAGWADAKRIGEAVRAAIAATAFDLARVPGGPGTLPVTVSIGVSSSQPGSRAIESPGALVHAADEAVYAAKKAGRNRVCDASTLAADSAAHEHHAPVPTSEPNKPRLLLVEDDPLSGRLIESALRKASGAEVVWVATIDLALSAITSALHIRPFHLIVSDYNIGQRSAVDLLRTMHTQGSRTPVVILSCDDTPEARTEAQNVGAVAWYSKHELANDLAGLMKSIVDRLPGNSAAAVKAA